MSILLVDGDPGQASIVKKVLQEFGHEVVCMPDGESAVRFLRTRMVDAVVLEWRLPGMSGLDVLRWMRAHLGEEPTALLLMSKMLDDDIAVALKEGADDYLQKPLREVELIGRIKVLLRRHGRLPGSGERIRVGAYAVDPSMRTISRYGKPIDLTAKEFALAAYLFSNLGRVISRDLLARLAWGRSLDRTSRTIDTHVSRIRRKLALRPENGLCLRAAYTHGYRLDPVATEQAPLESD
ncbi:two-component system response regulator (plasmid) [Burkholderia sp. MSMB0856]|uniref:response regulator transcription factor n=1 Tax=Burkholderia sp. MSMB0856 TaxID=1637869 RepID=UPI0008588A94|nr:response regulator transcription factor [Burkholderia sp. MSMB0856]AOJ85278.1 two-component system response regulator [Burkholderia sp. MSMB0856]